MSSAPEALFHFDGELSDEALAALTAVLLARAAGEAPGAAGPAEHRKARWRPGYRSPGSWK